MSGTYTGSDLPSGAGYLGGMAFILRRYKDTKVILFPSTSTLKTKVNTYSNGTWSGWEDF